MYTGTCPECGKLGLHHCIECGEQFACKNNYDHYCNLDEVRRRARAAGRGVEEDR